MDNIILGVAIYALPVISAITLHEAAHGYVAKHFGDITAYSQGRVSLNPLRHIDLMGTVIIPLTLFILSKLTAGAGFLFGWAKPVPVNFNNLHHPKHDMLWVAAAGPGANLLMALLWAVIIKVSLAMPESKITDFIMLMGEAGIDINVVLMALNLLPLPPLDGGRMAISLLPHYIAHQFSRIEPYGFMILLFLLFTGTLEAIMRPIIISTVQIVAWLVS